MCKQFVFILCYCGKHHFRSSVFSSNKDLELSIAPWLVFYLMCLLRNSYVRLLSVTQRIAEIHALKSQYCVNQALKKFNK